jgi:predicted phage terminase large subunit-like protein
MTLPASHWIRRLSVSSFLKRIEPLGPRERDIALRIRLPDDPELFALLTLPGHCRHPFAPVHRLVFDWHRRMGRDDLSSRAGLRFALAAPRGAAKSTLVSLILLLHDVVFHRERYIVLLSATERQARQRLRAIRAELDSPSVRPWIGSGIEVTGTTRSLRIGGVQIDVAGAGCELRGLNVDGWRPTKIVLDDAEPSRCADSPTARGRLLDWFAEVVEYLGDRYTHIVAIGTILHEKSLLASLLGRADFVSHRARSIITHAEGSTEAWTQWRRLLLDLSDPDRRQHAREFHQAHRADMDAGSEVLWPDKEDYEELMAQLTLQGRRAFAQEKQNEPMGPEEALFDPEQILRGFWRGSVLEIRLGAGDQATLLRSIPNAAKSGQRVGFLDSALGKGGQRGSGDFAALAVVLELPDGTMLVERLEARRIPPSQQVGRLYDLHALAPFVEVGVEGTGFQELLLLPIEEERRRRRAARQRDDLAVRAIRPTRSKAARIASLEPLLSAGRLVLAEGLDEELWDELRTWPRCRHDDALDALAGAVGLLQDRPQKTKKIYEGIRSGRAPLGTF